MKDDVDKTSATDNKSKPLDFNSELCSICKEHECVNAYLFELENANHSTRLNDNSIHSSNRNDDNAASTYTVLGAGANSASSISTAVIKQKKLSDLVCCEGVCLRSFHLGCLSEDVQESILNDTSNSKWICNDCENSSYECNVCHNYGTLYDITSDTNNKRYNNKTYVIKCIRDDCGRFFHKKCLLKYKNDFLKRHNLLTEETKEGNRKKEQQQSNEPLPLQTRKRKRGKPKDINGNNGGNEENISKYECPAHMCATCSKRESIRSANLGGVSQRLYTCNHCPTSYHLKCITPFCNVNASYMNCSEHYNSHLPKPRVIDHVNLKPTKEEKREIAARKRWEAKIKKQEQELERKREAEKQRLLKEETDEKKRLEINRKYALMQKPNYGKLLPFPIQEFEKILSNYIRKTPRFSKSHYNDRGHFRLKKSIITEVNSKPPPFKLIRSNVYLRPKPILQNIDMDNGECTCTSGTCSLSTCSNAMVFMECYGNCKKAKISNSKKVKSYNCCVGLDCGNRRLQKRQWSKFKAFNTHTHGWGLHADSDIAPNSLIIEYCGEVITNKMAEERLQQQKLNGDRHVYMMQLDNDCIIDARHRGNISRLINHSCDPNCQLQRWVVGAETRIAIVAIKKIKKGTELTYDYQLSANEEFKCLCGTKKCRGTLKAVPSDNLKRVEIKKQTQVDIIAKLQNQHQNKGWIKKQDLKLLKLENMKREKEKIEREVQFQNDKRKRLNMTNSFVPNNLEVANKSLSKYAINNMGSNSVRVHGKKHPIKNGPQMIDLSTQLNLTASHPFVGNDKPNIAHSTVFLWRNVMRGNNMLERYLLKKMDKKIRTNAHREVRLGKFPAKWDLRGV